MLFISHPDHISILNKNIIIQNDQSVYQNKMIMSFIDFSCKLYIRLDFWKLPLDLHISNEK